MTQEWPQSNDGNLLTVGPWPGGESYQSGGAWDVLQLTRKLVDEWVATEHGIRGDPRLSGLGMTQALEAAVPAFLARLDQLEARLASERAANTALELVLLQPIKPADALDLARQAEFRTWWLARLAPEDRPEKLDELIRTQDRDSLRALYDAPTIMGLLTEDQRDRIGALLLSAADPRRFAKWQRQCAQVALVAYPAEQARRRIAGSTGGMTASAVASRTEDELMARRLQYSADGGRAA